MQKNDVLKILGDYFTPRDLERLTVTREADEWHMEIVPPDSGGSVPEFYGRTRLGDSPKEIADALYQRADRILVARRNAHIGGVYEIGPVGSLCDSDGGMPQPRRIA